MAGLYGDEINKIMKKLKLRKDGFQGVISSNEIYKIKPKNKLSFIMNLDPNYKSGSHWIAIYIDTIKDKSVEYFDSFGVNPSKKTIHDLKKLINKINPKYMLKLKINKIQKQDDRSFDCGYFSIKFLYDRYNGISFKRSTGYKHEIHKYEKNIKQFESKIKKFGYI